MDAHEPGGLVLLVDDEPLFVRALTRILRPEGHRLLTAQCVDEVSTALEDPALEVVLLDLQLGQESGLVALDLVKRLRPDVEVVMMTGHASVENAVDCMQRGALDYLEKPIQDAHRVRNTVTRALERRRLLHRNDELERALARQANEPILIGTSQAIRDVSRTIQSLRHNESTVLIQGESGTGKELVAASIHTSSPRRDQTFVPVDCGALPETIIESELFGHEKGAFTGAVGAPGLFRAADGGTLFLDEIGELAPAVQARLLRALQEREVRPVGSGHAVSVDLRIVAATNRNLQESVDQGEFRQDLFYRLDVVRIELPPLRKRREDIPLLATHFFDKHRGVGTRVEGFEPAAMTRLGEYAWPGNVRELENAVESALALCPNTRLRPEDFSLGSGRSVEVSQPEPSDLPLSLDAYERCVLERALGEARGDATGAARRLGIGRSTLYRKLAKHGLSPRRVPEASTPPGAAGSASIR
jgi:two-component system response regulator AtoC